MIRDVAVESYAYALRDPLATARGTIEGREGFFIHVETDDGTGVGEAAPLPGWTESLDDTRRALEDARTALLADGFDAALRDLADAPAARHAVSLARLDHDARRDGVPLYQHLGGQPEVASVPVNATVGDAEPAETASRAAEATADGFRAVKVKIGRRPVEEDSARLAAVRDAVGDGVELRADANGAWSRRQARRAIEAFAGLDVAFVEQPLSADDLAGHAALRGGPVDVALDETLATHGLDAVVDAAAADVVVLKPMSLGGVDRTRAMARRARAAGLDVVVTTTVDAAIARTGAVHVAASLTDVPACGLATADRLAEDCCPDPAPVVDGTVRVPQAPGLGPEVDTVDA